MSTTLFTTNYDLSLEVFARELPNKFELVDGFRKLASGEEVSNWNFVPMYNAWHAIILRKLHGSTTWKVVCQAFNSRRKLQGRMWMEIGGQS